jgi:tetratricopeptide (TPR) repeat protein
MQKNKQYLPQYLLTTLFFILVAAFSVHKLVNFDIWWHLKAGEWIFTNHSVPRASIFSGTAQYPWIDVHWLFQLISYLVYKTSGVNGLILTKTVVLLCAFGVLFKTCARDNNWLIAIAACLIAVLVSNNRFFVRPEIITLLFVACYLYILDRFKYDDMNYLWVLPVIQVFWSNMHGLAVIGPVILAAYLIGELVSWKMQLPYEWNDEFSVTFRRYRKLVIVTGLVIIGWFITPYMHDGMLLPVKLFRHFTGDVFSNTITEFQPLLSARLLDTYTVWFTITMMLVTVISFIYNYRKLSITNAILFIGFTVLALSAMRNTALFAFVAAPVLTYNFANGSFPGIKSGFNKKLVGLVETILIGLVILLITWSVITNRYYIRNADMKEFGFGVSKIVYPEGAADFIIKNNLAGNMFNSVASGGYMIWKCGPGRPVFIDGRLELYSSEFYSAYLKAIQNEQAWNELSAKYSINYVVLKFGFPDAANLIRMLYVSNKWKLVFYDDNSVVFIKNVPANRQLIKKFNVDFSKNKRPGIWFSSDPPLYEYHEFGFFDKIEFPYVSYGRGFFFSLIGQDALAVEEFTNTVIQYPKYAQAYFNLGISYVKLNMQTAAKTAFLRTVSLDPSNFEANSNLARIYFMQGDYDQSVYYNEKLIKLRPGYVQAYYNLGIIYGQIGRYEQSYAQFERVLLMQPDNADAKRKYEYLKTVLKKN